MRCGAEGQLRDSAMEDLEAGMSRSSAMVDIESARKQVERVCERLALLHLSYAKAICEELGDEKGTDLILKTIKRYGTQIGTKARERAISLGQEPTPDRYEEDLPAYGMHDRLEFAVVSGERRMRAFGCAMGKFWRERKEQGLGRLYCYIDIAKYMAFNPMFKLVHTKTLLDGDSYCEFAVRRTTDEERKDFASTEEDWTYIDR